MTKLTTQASIGIGVPLGIIVLAVFAGLIYANVAHRRKHARGEVELTKVDPEAPKPKAIRWNPYG